MLVWFQFSFQPLKAFAAVVNHKRIHLHTAGNSRGLSASSVFSVPVMTDGASTLFCCSVSCCLALCCCSVTSGAGADRVMPEHNNKLAVMKAILNFNIFNLPCASCPQTIIAKPLSRHSCPPARSRLLILYFAIVAEAPIFF